MNLTAGLAAYIVGIVANYLVDLADSFVANSVASSEKNNYMLDYLDYSAHSVRLVHLVHRCTADLGADLAFD